MLIPLPQSVFSLPISCRAAACAPEAGLCIGPSWPLLATFPLSLVPGPVAPVNLSRALRSVRPADAQDIKVLKDVSSTSVYGGAGAHGVILITTKGDR
jgi:TonB-dependent SusC/RagA subfamily outer membrane receptor